MPRIFDVHQWFRRTTRRSSIPLLLLVVALGCVTACNPGGSPSPDSNGKTASKKLTDLKRQRDDVLYELELRQEEVKQMDVHRLPPGTRVPGGGIAIGVSKEWLARRDELREEIIRLKVKLHDFDLQIAELSQSRKH